MGCGAAALAGAGGLLGGSAHPCLAQTSFTAEDRQRILRPGVERPDVLARYPVPRNARFNADRPLTDPLVAATHNNFYEFTTDKQKVWELAQDFNPDPWTIQVTGLCRKPRTFDIDEIDRLFGGEMEERVYRFRCVEAWAMDVPWTGFELNRLLRRVEPKSDAKFVRFVSHTDPKTMDGVVSQPWYPWPYFEALRMDEAMHELTLFVTGVYGKPLPRQHGAPFRIIVPWKYGYKSPKSIVTIELTAQQPPIFWNQIAPDEYDFFSNINPDVPHPRWSQKTERLIGTGEERPTLPLGGYGHWVAGLYTK